MKVTLHGGPADGLKFDVPGDGPIIKVLDPSFVVAMSHGKTDDFPMGDPVPVLTYIRPQRGTTYAYYNGTTAKPTKKDRLEKIAARLDGIRLDLLDEAKRV